MSTVENWKRELEAWTDLNTLIFHGSAMARDLIYQYEWYFENPKKKQRTKMYKFQAIITTYEVVMIESARLKSVPWQYLIVDEGHRLKVRESQQEVMTNNVVLHDRKLFARSKSQYNEKGTHFTFGR